MPHTATPIDVVGQGLDSSIQPDERMEELRQAPQQRTGEPDYINTW